MKKYWFSWMLGIVGLSSCEKQSSFVIQEIKEA